MDSYKTKYYESYAKNHVAVSERDLQNKINSRKEYFVRVYGKFFPKNKDSNIVDVGCGKGGINTPFEKE